MLSTKEKKKQNIKNSEVIYLMMITNQSFDSKMKNQYKNAKRQEQNIILLV